MPAMRLRTTPRKVVGQSAFSLTFDIHQTNRIAHTNEEFATRSCPQVRHHEVVISANGPHMVLSAWIPCAMSHHCSPNLGHLLLCLQQRCSMYPVFTRYFPATLPSSRQRRSPQVAMPLLPHCCISDMTLQSWPWPGPLGYLHLSHGWLAL